MAGKKQQQTGVKHVHILVSGFGPFPDNPVNPSAELVLYLNKAFKNHSRIKLSHLILKTEFAGSYEKLAKKIRKTKPDLVIAFGLRAAAHGFELETTARNKTGGAADAKEQTAGPGKIKRTGKPALSSTLPLHDIEQALERKNIAVSLSENAGDYLCNYIFYRLMADIDSGKIDATGGFIHIPYTKKLARQYQGDKPVHPVAKKELQKGAGIIIRAAAQAVLKH